MPTRTESECTTSSSLNDDDVELGCLWDMDDVTGDSNAAAPSAIRQISESDSDVFDAESDGQVNSKSYITLKERRQIKLGLRKVGVHCHCGGL